MVDNLPAVSDAPEVDASQPPWERLGDEDIGAWTAFRLYRDLEPKERSLKRVQLALAQDLATPTSDRTLKNWARRYSWLERAQAFDEVTREDLARSVIAAAKATGMKQVEVSSFMLDASSAIFQRLIQYLVEEGNLSRMGGRELLRWAPIATEIGKNAHGQLRALAGEAQMIEFKGSMTSKNVTERRLTLDGAGLGELIALRQVLAQALQAKRLGDLVEPETKMIDSTSSLPTGNTSSTGSE